MSNDPIQLRVALLAFDWTPLQDLLKKHGQAKVVLSLTHNAVTVDVYGPSHETIRSLSTRS